MYFVNYLIINIMIIYLECLKNCQNCISGNKCEKCYDNYYLIEDLNNTKCVECSELGSYNMNKNCQICKNENECEKCSPKFYLINNSNLSECLKMDEISYYVYYEEYSHSFIIYYSTVNKEFLSMVKNSSFSIEMVGLQKNVDFNYEIIENNSTSFKINFSFNKTENFNSTAALNLNILEVPKTFYLLYDKLFFEIIPKQNNCSDSTSFDKGFIY